MECGPVVQYLLDVWTRPNLSVSQPADFFLYPYYFYSRMTIVKNVLNASLNVKLNIKYLVQNNWCIYFVSGFARKWRFRWSKRKIRYVCLMIDKLEDAAWLVGTKHRTNMWAVWGQSCSDVDTFITSGHTGVKNTSCFKDPTRYNLI